MHLARGRGFTQEVVGESFRQENILAYVGKKRPEGSEEMVVVQLVFDDGNPHDPDAVGVLLDRRHVGYIPRNDAKRFRDQIEAINPAELPITCDGKIIGGWDRGDRDAGDFGIVLSLAKPLRAA